MRFRDRLSYKQARNTVAIAFLLGLILGLFQVVYDYKAQSEGIDASIEAYLDTSEAPASRIAYNIDEELALELVNGLIASPMILKAEIVDSDGLSLALASGTSPVDGNPRYTDIFFGATRSYWRALSVPYDINEELRWLRIVADTRPVGGEFLHRSFLTLGSGIVRTLLLALLLQSLFYLMLTKPLLQLTRSMGKARTESDNHPLAIPSGHERDEIGLLTRTLNNYQQNIRLHLHHRSVAEEELRSHLKALESIIDQRTRELQKNNDALSRSNQALEKARRKALNAAQLRGDQLSSLSHEIRTPLNGILGMLELTLQDELTDQQFKRLNLAHQSGVKLVKLLPKSCKAHFLNHWLSPIQN